MKIYRYKKNFNLDDLLAKPLFAHLATVEDDAPRNSPVWFHWEDEKLWIIGMASDSFPKRIIKNPKCAVGIVDFNAETGLVLHAGFRGQGKAEPLNQKVAHKIISKYLGDDQGNWDPRFKALDDSNYIICITPETVVVRDQSYARFV